MYKNRIFGTPPEPVFNMKSACLPPELLEEALYVLADENEKSMDNASGIQGFFKGGKTAGKRVHLHVIYFLIFVEKAELLKKTQSLGSLTSWTSHVCVLPIISEYVFLLCGEMGLPMETRFLAIEIFDK